MRGRIYTCGYTLIEVLVAFTILALTLTVLLRIFSGGLRNVSASSDYASAVLIAESQLAVIGLDSALSPGTTQGTEDKRFQWTRTISSYSPFPGYAASAKYIPAYYISVTVEWPHGNGMRSIDLGTVRLIRAKDQES